MNNKTALSQTTSLQNYEAFKTQKKILLYVREEGYSLLLG